MRTVKKTNSCGFLSIFLILIFLFWLCPVNVSAEPGKSVNRLLTGPIDDAHWTSNAIIVYATGQDDKKSKKQFPEFEAMMKKKVNDMMAKVDERVKYTLIRDIDFKPKKHFGKGTLYLCGPFEHHSVLKKYYKIPFKIKNNNIYAGHHIFSGTDKGVIMVWPQPDNLNYTVIITGTSYSALLNNSSIAHGPDDYVIFSEKSWKTSSFTDFEMRGFFKKSFGKWTFSEETAYFPETCDDFFKNIKSDFSSRVFEKYDIAPKRVVTLKDGQIFTDVKIFKSDEDKVFIISEKNGEAPDVREVKFSEIKNVKGFKVISKAIFFPRHSKRSHFLKVSLDNSNLADLSCVSVIKVFNDTDETMEFFDFNGCRAFDSVQDIFGNDLEFRTNKIILDSYIHRIKLQSPVRPGEDLLLRAFWKIKKGVISSVSNDNERLILNTSYFSRDDEELSVYIEVPDGYEFVKSIPQLEKAYDMPTGKILFYKLYLAKFNGFFSNVIVQKKMPESQK